MKLPGGEDLELHPWRLVYRRFHPGEQGLRESLCALGNGYVVTRGAAEEMRPGGPHYPGTYLHGGYNRLESHIGGRVVENEDLVNWPSWLPLTFRPEGGEWFRIDAVTLLRFRQELDLRRGVLERHLCFRDDNDRETVLVSRRLVHMKHPHVAALQWELVPQNWSGVIEIRSAIDGAVSNEGVERYRSLNGQHLEALGMGRVGEDAVYLSARTVRSHIEMTQAARTRVYADGVIAAADRRTRLDDRQAAQHITVECFAEKPLIIEKIVAIHTSRDHAIAEPQAAAAKTVRRADGFERLFTTHVRAWADLWARADIELLGASDPDAQLALRLHIFHLLQTTSLNTVDRDVGVPARGLHGEAYRGHVFWDELYIFPFLNFRLPELTRSLLMYRYRRLNEARHAAKAAGFEGAMYPWQSGSDGREESQVVHLNPVSGRWIPDNTHRQRHVNAAVAYNVWHYFEATGDMEFLAFYGVEMLLSIARFWASIAHYNPKRRRYEIHDVVGPDEYHTAMPGAATLGLKNNAYTNLMAAWCLKRACEAITRMAEDRREELFFDVDLTPDEVERWDHIARNFYVPMSDGVIFQFEGWEDLEELDWEHYRRKYTDIQRLDRLLEAEGDSTNRYKVAKQADVLMLFFLFSKEQLEELFEGLGYEFSGAMIPKNIDYYVRRCTHGSTLSRVVEAWVLSRSDRPRSWRLFLDALASDLGDIQGGTTSEGIHLGAMAGSVDLIQRCYTGLEVREDVLWLNPRLPRQLGGLTCRLRYRGHWLTLRTTHDELFLRLDKGWSPSVRVGVGDEVYEMHQGEERRFALGDDSGGTYGARSENEARPSA